MLAEIEQAIVDRFAARGLGVKGKIGKKKGNSSVVPSTFVAVEEGTFKKVGQLSFHQVVNVYVTVEFKNLKGEEARRQGVYPLLSGVIGVLALQKLGLSIDPVMPVRFANVTDLIDKKSGVTAFQVIFRTGFYIEKMEDQVAEDLLKVGIEYFQDGDMARDPADASDEITI